MTRNAPHPAVDADLRHIYAKLTWLTDRVQALEAEVRELRAAQEREGRG